MKTRTKEFAKEIIKLCRKLPANSCRARSTADFVSKLSIVEEEADETLFWLEILEEMEILDKNLIVPLMQENDEIIAIIVSSIKTSRKRK